MLRQKNSFNVQISKCQDKNTNEQVTPLLRRGRRGGLFPLAPDFYKMNITPVLPKY